MTWHNSHPKLPKIDPHQPPFLPNLKRITKTSEQVTLESLQEALLKKTDNTVDLTQAIVNLTDDQLKKLNERLKISTQALKCISKFKEGEDLYDKRQALFDAVQLEIKARKKP